MSLSSGILKKHKEKFILDEDGLRRIEAVLKKAIESQGEKLTLYFRIEREDHRFYETYELEDVLKDPNVTGKKIELLLIILENSDNLGRIVTIAFDKQIEPSILRREVYVKISSENRTWALMLADDLESQILRLFKVKKINRAITVTAYVLLAVINYYLIKYLADDNSDITKKLVKTFLTTVAASLIFHMLFKIFALPKWIQQNFSTQSVFLWGEEESEYGDRIKLQSNIYWVVVVGFAVSLVSGIALLYFGSPKV